MKNVELICVTSIKEDIKSNLNSNCKVVRDWRDLLDFDELNGVIVCARQKLIVSSG